MATIENTNMTNARNSLHVHHQTAAHNTAAVITAYPSIQQTHQKDVKNRDGGVLPEHFQYSLANYENAPHGILQHPIRCAPVQSCVSFPSNYQSVINYLQLIPLNLTTSVPSVQPQGPILSLANPLTQFQNQHFHAFNQIAVAAAAANAANTINANVLVKPPPPSSIHHHHQPQQQQQHKDVAPHHPANNNNMHGNNNLNSLHHQTHQQQQQLQHQPPQLNQYLQHHHNQHYQQHQHQHHHTLRHGNGSTEKILGNGAFGVVWQVNDPRTNEKLAMKRISNVFHSLTSSKRAFRELKMLMYLKHQNVISLIDIVRDDQRRNACNEIHLLFEFMDYDLHKIIFSQKKLSLAHIKLLFYQILRGLKFLHSADIIHRDIKPGNLLVNRNFLLKICDFGLARVDRSSGGGVGGEVATRGGGSGDNPGHPNLPAIAAAENLLTPQVVTQYYRAPELILGSSSYERSIDIWSAGCILAELFSNKILFESQMQIDQLQLIIHIVGCPDVGAMSEAELRASKAHYWSAASLSYMKSQKPRPINYEYLQQLSGLIDVNTLWLFSHMLKFNQNERISAESALKSPFFEHGRQIFHSSLCNCCDRSSSQQTSSSAAPATPGIPPPSSFASSSSSAFAFAAANQQNAGNATARSTLHHHQHLSSASASGITNAPANSTARLSSMAAAAALANPGTALQMHHQQQQQQANFGYAGVQQHTQANSLYAAHQSLTPYMQHHQLQQQARQLPAHPNAHHVNGPIVSPSAYSAVLAQYQLATCQGKNANHHHHHPQTQQQQHQQQQQEQLHHQPQYHLKVAANQAIPLSLHAPVSGAPAHTHQPQHYPIEQLSSLTAKMSFRPANETANSKNGNFSHSSSSSCQVSHHSSVNKGITVSISSSTTPGTSTSSTATTAITTTATTAKVDTNNNSSSAAANQRSGSSDSGVSSIGADSSNQHSSCTSSSSNHSPSGSTVSSGGSADATANQSDVTGAAGAVASPTTANQNGAGSSSSPPTGGGGGVANGIASFHTMVCVMEPSYAPPAFWTQAIELEFESEKFSSLQEARATIYNLIQTYFSFDPSKSRLIINSFSPSYTNFIRSSVSMQNSVNHGALHNRAC